jgi:hypothetical protein
MMSGVDKFQQTVRKGNTIEERRKSLVKPKARSCAFLLRQTQERRTSAGPGPRGCRCSEPAGTSSAETSGTVASALGRRPAQAGVRASPLARRPMSSPATAGRESPDRSNGGVPGALNRAVATSRIGGLEKRGKAVPLVTAPGAGRNATRLRSVEGLGTRASECNRRSDGGLDERLRHRSGDGVDRLPTRTVGGYHPTHAGRE